MSQAGQVGTNLQFLNLIFQNPNSKCLLVCAQSPFVLHRAMQAARLFQTLL